MNTVTLRNDVYEGVQRYAQRQNISVDEVVNNLVITHIVNASTPSSDKPAFRMKTEQELSPVVRDLIGIMPEEPDTTEARAKYLKEKHGV